MLEESLTLGPERLLETSIYNNQFTQLLLLVDTLAEFQAGQEISHGKLLTKAALSYFKPAIDGQNFTQTSDSLKRDVMLA